MSQTAASQLGRGSPSSAYFAQLRDPRIALPILNELRSPDRSSASTINHDPWLAAFHRTNEFVSAHSSFNEPHINDHNPKDWQFSRSTPDAISIQPKGAPDALLPVINPITRLSFFAPPSNNSVKTIMLDPGHGGSDPGTVGTHGLLEKHLTLDIARRVKHLLASHPNLNVVLTRHDDKGYSRQMRMLKVQAMQPDILISLHLNNLPQKNLTLVESFYASHSNIRESEEFRSNKFAQKVKGQRKARYAFVEDSRRLAGLLQERLFHQVSQDNANAINAGTKEDTLFMLTRSYLPATLIELTCLSNSREEKRLKTPQYRQELAIALARGILDYFATEKSTIKS